MPKPKNILYVNMRCSKCREALALLKGRGVEVSIVEYLTAPLGIDELDDICTRLGIEPLAVMRTKEPRFAELGLRADDVRSRREWLRLIAENPVLLERPILVYHGKAAIGRPPENLLRIL